MTQRQASEISENFPEVTTSNDDDKISRKRDREKLLAAVKKNWKRMRANIHAFLVEAKVYEMLNCTAQFVKAHPILSSICVTALATLIIPLCTFVLFIAVNVAFAFTGFIFIEVTILTISVTILCCVFFALVLTILAILTCGALTWITLSCFLQEIRNR